MKQIQRIILTAFFLVISLIVVAAQTKLSNRDIIDMQKAGISESIILAKINNTSGEYDTSTAALGKLKSAGLGEQVILAIVNKNSVSNPMALPSGSILAPSNPLSAGVFSSGGVTLAEGTEIKVQTESEINGNNVAEGDALIFKVSDDIKVNERVVIAKNATVKGVVTAASKNGMMGKGGKLNVRIDSVETVDGQKLKLRSSKSGEGGDSMASTIALTVLFGPLGLLKHGKAAKIKSGTVLTTYADENKTILPKN